MGLLWWFRWCFCFLGVLFILVVMSELSVSGGSGDGGAVVWEGDPWDRLEGEAVHEHALFRQYCRLARRVDPVSGEPLRRRLSVMVDESDYSERHLRRLCSRWRWIERADAWDRAREGDLLGLLADKRVEVLEGRVAVLGELCDMAVEVLRGFGSGDWRPREAIDLLRVVLAGQDALFGLMGGGRVVSGGMGDVSDVGEVDGRIDEIVSELVSRGELGASGGGVGELWVFRGCRRRFCVGGWRGWRRVGLLRRLRGFCRGIIGCVVIIG